MEVPGTWEADPNYAEWDGFAWYRCFVTVPADWAGSRFLLTVEAIDDVDEAFVNGQKVGANGGMPPLYGDPSSAIRRPAVVEPDQIRFGEPNLIAFRVYDKGDHGGIVKGPIQLARLKDALDLSGRWDFITGDQRAYGQWPDAPERALADYHARHGDKAAGYLGIVPADLAGRERVMATVRKNFEGNPNDYASTEGKGDPLPPEAVAPLLKLGAGFTLDTVLSEPLVRQPLYMEFDERARLWITQYIQYPRPAGLEILAWDNHLRTVFDAVPPPPPYDRPEEKKFIGLDKITIHEDTDGDGIFDHHKTFLEGLNLATSTAQGLGGVWVMNPPYLLFYPDANRDDVPDGDPVVHLSGFGLEDTHSIANSLKWGPDGWLYGATGSTVTARVKAALDPSQAPLSFFGQNIWRYHPESHRFELFAEGGWNTFGVDFDDVGRCYSGTNGGMQAVHFVQGGFYQKGFGKHGPHTNPFAFDYFSGIPMKGDTRRMVHQWLPYHGGALPGHEGHLFGVNPLANNVSVLALSPDGSTFVSDEQEKAIATEHKWFRPIHATLGPEGAIYIADFYDARITHVDPRDNWDRRNGRIYRLQSTEKNHAGKVDLSRFSSRELVDELSHPNQLRRNTARRLLGQRGDRSVIPPLRDLLGESGQPALEALWTLHLLGVRDEALQQRALRHPNRHVRVWATRLLGDDTSAGLPTSLSQILRDLAFNDSDPEVASQLASTAQRLAPTDGLAIVEGLLTSGRFTADPFLPNQIWWALESLVTRDTGAVLKHLESATLWRTPLFETKLAKLLARRLAADPTETNLARCATLITLAPDASAVQALISGMETGLQGIELAEVPVALDEAMTRLWAEGSPSPELIAFGMKLHSRSALEAAKALVRSPTQPIESRIALLAHLAEAGDVESLTGLALSNDAPMPLRQAALNASRRLLSPKTATTLLARLPDELKSTALSVIAGKAETAIILLDAVADKQIARESVSMANLLVMKAHASAVIDTKIQSLWGTLRQSDETKQKRITEVLKTLESAPGDAALGAVLFGQSCAVCHRLFDQGLAVGPELTGYDRSNREFLVNAIVDPNLGLREEFELVTLSLRPKDGETEKTILSGFVRALGENSLTLVDLTGNVTTVATNEILSKENAPVSIMPEGLLDALTEAQIRDLFAYLQATKTP